MSKISFSNFYFSANGNQIISDFDLEIEDGEFLILLGPSGSGKTTLLRSINGFVEPTNGELVIDDKSVKSLKNSELRQLRRNIGFIFQDFNLIPRISVRKNVLCGRLGYLDFTDSVGSFPEEETRIAKNCLERVHMRNKANQKVKSLSEGEKQRVAIARALAQKPDIMLADEPSANLDHGLAHEIMDLLISLWEEKKETMILSTHDLGLVREFCENKRIVGLNSGEKIYDSKIEELDSKIVAKIYGGDYGF